MTTSVRFLAERANARLADLGVTPLAGQFVCPMCLRLFPLSAERRGDFPARSVRAERHRLEVQCGDCNSGIGGTYEKTATEFLESIQTVTMTRPGGAGSFVKRRARIRNDREADAIAVELTTSKRTKDLGRNPRTREHLDRMLATSREPRVMRFEVARPTDEPARRAFLAWSYLALFRAAGYRYAGSPGAHLARRLLLDPLLALPEGIVISHGALKLPLQEPALVLIAHSEDDGTDELVAMGVQWHSMIAVFPFASDRDDRAWRRVGELLAIDGFRSLRMAPLQLTPPEPGDQASWITEVSDDSGIRRGVTIRFTPEEADALAHGQSPFRLQPLGGRGWRPPMAIQHEFLTIEGNPPPLRTDHWRARLTAMGGGYLPELLGRLLEEIPTVPRPIPDSLPLRMEKVAEGWRATLLMSPGNISGGGSSPGEAVAVMLATVERDLEIESIVAASFNAGPGP